MLHVTVKQRSQSRRRVSLCRAVDGHPPAPVAVALLLAKRVGVDVTAIHRGSRKLCLTGFRLVDSARLKIVTVITRTVGDGESRCVPQGGQRPRRRVGQVSNHVDSSAGPVQVSASLRRPTHATAGEPEMRVQGSQEHR